MTKSLLKLSQIILPFLVIICFSTTSNAQCDPDLDAPSFSCPTGLEAQCSSMEQAPYAFFADFIAAGGMASDLCGLDTTSLMVITEMSDGATCPEIVTRVYQIADTQGNTATCSQEIYVFDSIVPIFLDCVDLDTIIYTQAVGCNQEFTYTDPMFSDNCLIVRSEVTITLVGQAPTTTDISSGVEFNYTFDEGENVIEFELEDECGNTATCTINVTVVDTFPPVFEPMVDIVVQAESLQCDSVIIFAPLTATDDCDGPRKVIQIDGTGLSSGSAFPVGTTTLTFESVDGEGNSSTLSFDVIVNEFQPDGLACLSEINLSIDAFTCESVVTPEMVLTTTALGCAENCTVEIMELDETPRSSLFTATDVGESFMYRVCCGDLCCMGIVNVEDKTPPQIECVNDTITCAQLVNFAPPLVTENCTNVTFTLLNEYTNDVACSDPLLQKIVTREYQAVDGAGNVSNTCIQTLSIEQFDIGTITPPIQPTVNLECGIPFPMDEFGGPNPNVYGSPQVGGVNVLPNQLLICNLFITYEDQIVPTSPSNYSIIRTFDATVWYCGSDTMRQFIQIFNVNDTQGPSITCPGDMTFSTSGFDCTAEVQLPAIPVSDLCSSTIEVDIQYEGGFIDNSNGGLAALPNGSSVVTYIATDSNGQMSSCSFNVLVADNAEPTPICELYTTIALTDGGQAIVAANVFDDGSYDECGPVTIQVRRMTPTCDPNDAIFQDSVTFCCADLGTEQMVVLRVTDGSGNFNECMVFAEVQDKIAPQLIQGLPDITLSCEFPFNTEDTEQFGTIQFDYDAREEILLTADVVQFGGQAIDGFVLGNCLELESDEFTFSSINSCNTGTATRIITIRNSAGMTVSDVQFITFVNPSPFTFNDVNFPPDLTLTNICDVSLTDPMNLPAPFGFPTFTEDLCDQVGITYDDKFIDNSDGAQSCYKIIRTYTLLDWCQSSGGSFATFEDEQIILVNNNIAPEITGDCANRTMCSFDIACGPMYVELTNSGTDDCTSNEFLEWSYTIDLNTNGSIDLVGNSSDASSTYPVGLHTITWTLNDRCGNIDECTYTFEIENCKAATPICLDNLTAGLTAMDLDNDGEFDTEMIIIPASYFDGGSYHVCGTPVTLSFSSNPADSILTFDCDDIGEQPIQLWVTDVNGNQDFCTTSLDVQDNNNHDFCPSMLTGTITGEIYNEDNEFINKVDVVLEGAELVSVTAENGSYSFIDMPTGGTYVVNPNKDIDHLNGITTLDIILIQKHILGIQMFESPFQLIAADINHSDNITGQDIVQLRKLLLGKYANFPDNKSWRFVDTEHIFLDPMNPWITEITESHEIPSLAADMVINFNGVKIGDVNNTALPNELIGEQITTRSGEALSLTLSSDKILQGKSWIPVSSENFDEIVGMQFALEYSSDIKVLDVRGASIEIEENNFNINTDNRTLSVVWHTQEASSVEEDQILFEILIESLEDSKADNMFTISNDILFAESYDMNLDAKDIELRIRSTNSTNSSIIPQLTLSQNEPNPWMNFTTIVVETSVAGKGQLTVMDIAGKVVLSRDIATTEGRNEFILTKDDISSTGVLYYEITIGELRMMKKMVLLQ